MSKLPDDWEDQILIVMPPGYDELLDRHLTAGVNRVLERARGRALHPEEKDFLLLWAARTWRPPHHFEPPIGG